MDLFYHHYGNGQPIIILHGIFGISDNWVSIARKLSKNYSVYIPDLRNHGRSPHSEAFNFEVLAEDIKEFCEQHNLKKVVIAGHSLGGKIAMQVAMDFPHLVDKLIVVDISPCYSTIPNIYYNIIDAMKSVDFNECKNRQMVENHINLEISDRSLSLFILKNLYHTKSNNYGWRPNIDAIAANLDSTLKSIDESLVYKKPTLFLKGEESDYINDNDEKMIKKMFPSSNIITIPKANHWVHADNPAAVYNAIANFA